MGGEDRRDEKEDWNQIHYFITEEKAEGRTGLGTWDRENGEEEELWDEEKGRGLY